MKKGLMLLFFLTFISSQAFADGFLSSGDQTAIDKGSKMLAGSFSFSTSGGDLYEWNGNRLTRFQINCSYSSFLGKGFALGGHLSIEHKSRGSFSSSSYGVGPQIICFPGRNRPKPHIKGANYPYFGLAFTYTHYSGDLDGSLVDLGVGNIHMLTRTVGVPLELTYQMEKVKSAKGNSFNVTAGLIVFIY